MVEVRHVIDGDTVILTDNRHVRLIGINAPEIDHHGQATQTGAIKARKFLEELLNEQQQLYLVYDHDRFDRYQRTLAHLFLADGSNIQGMLLQQGLAFPLTIPPNLTFLNCYQYKAQVARDKSKGVWSLDDYQPLSVTNIAPDDIGYRIIVGKVSRISSGTSATWLDLEPNVSLYITHQDRRYFDKTIFNRLVNQEVQARGWLYFRDNKYHMRIRHPVDLTRPGLMSLN